MKHLFLGLCLFITATSLSQNCKVLLPNLDGTYEGECKNKLAHGKGTAKGKETYEGEFRAGLPDGEGKYVYEDGSYYVGEFRKGLRNGEGKMSQFNKETNTITTGKNSKWKNDVFVEEILEKKYKIIENINTMGILFEKPDEREDKVEIFLGTRSVLSGVSVTPSSGTSYMSGNNRAIIENIQFPLVVKLSYSATKGVGASTSVRLDFELQSKGHWKITVNSQ